MSQNEISFHGNGGAIYAGPKGVNVFRLRVLAGAIRLYAKCGVIPTRGVTISKMMKQAEADTGKKFKRGAYIEAAEALDLVMRQQAAEVAAEMKGGAVGH